MKESRTHFQGWKVVMKSELRQLWFSWKAPLLLLAFSLLLSIFVLLLTLDPEINVLSQAGMIHLVIQVTVLVGMFVVFLPSAHSFSGERDQRTLESLMLTPIPRGQIAVGKLLATLSLWVCMLPIAVPYLWLVSSGTGLLGRALLLLLVLGTCLVVMSAGLSTLISGLAPSNIFSFAISAIVLFVLAAPTQLPGAVRDLSGVRQVLAFDPFVSATKYQSGVLVDGLAWTTELYLVAAPLAVALLVAVLLPSILNQKVSLHGGWN